VRRLSEKRRAGRKPVAPPPAGSSRSRLSPAGAVAAAGAAGSTLGNGEGSNGNCDDHGEARQRLTYGAKGGTSRFHGVSWKGANKKWQARIKVCVRRVLFRPAAHLLFIHACRRLLLLDTCNGQSAIRQHAMS
jgi:hypothetical protein